MNTLRDFKQAPTPSVVMVYSDGCGACRNAKPRFEELSKELSAPCYQMDVRHVTSDLGIRAIPTFLIVISSGVEKVVGWRPQDIRDKISTSAPPEPEDEEEDPDEDDDSEGEESPVPRVVCTRQKGRVRCQIRHDL